VSGDSGDSKIRTLEENNNTNTNTNPDSELAKVGERLNNLREATEANQSGNGVLGNSPKSKDDEGVNLG
jgi:hypothetical protein